MIVKEFPIACPVDMLPLSRNTSGYNCTSAHNFDMARKGYVNLLPPQFKSSLDPGDKKEMVKARTDFLETGTYDFILAGVCVEIEKYIVSSSAKHINIVDAGCGEGYYTAGIADYLGKVQSDKTFSLLGYDISKEAVHKAAGRSKNVSWAVATNKRIPASDKTADIVLSLFGFPVPLEFHRILKSDGILLMVEPAPEHLMEIRKLIYNEIIEKFSEDKHRTIDDYFTLADKLRLTEVKNNLDAMTVVNLINMTPHVFKADKVRLEAVLASPPCSVTADIFIRTFSPKWLTNCKYLI